MIGEWLRQQPVTLKLGSVLFVHGGISPRVARTGLDVGQLHAAMQDYWNDTDPHPTSPGLDAVLGHAGVTQYPGWFRAPEGRYPEASDARVAAALERTDARLTVVGHTIVPVVDRMRNGRADGGSEEH